MTDRLRVVRFLVAGYAAAWLAIRLPYVFDLTDLPARRWEPVGVLTPLAEPPAAGLVRFLAVAAIGACAALAVGWRLRVAAPVAASLVLAVTTYTSSWGQLFHTENLVVVHLVVLAVAAVARRPDPALVLRAIVVATAAAYVVSGVAKLRNGGLDWLDGDALRHQVAFDNVRKAVIGAPHSPLGAAALDHRWLFGPMAVASLGVELGAPAALLGRRWMAGWAAAAWAFHVGVLALMAIGFPYQLAGVAFAAGLPVERLRAPTLLRRWSASSSPPVSSPSSSP